VLFYSNNNTRQRRLATPVGRGVASEGGGTGLKIYKIYENKLSPCLRQLSNKLLKSIGKIEEESLPREEEEDVPPPIEVPAAVVVFFNNSYLF
jgi:hypothetical protein